LEYSADIHVGDRVQILQPEYLAGKNGIVISREEGQDNQTGDRWLVQVIPDNYLVSLLPHEFCQSDLLNG
jgi:hypothetical protein